MQMYLNTYTNIFKSISNTSALSLVYICFYSVNPTSVLLVTMYQCNLQDRYDGDMPTYFRFLTVMAFYVFIKEKVSFS